MTLLFLAILSCEREIHVGDTVKIKGEIVGIPEGIEVISLSPKYTEVVALKAGEYNINLDGDVVVNLKVKTLLEGDIENRVNKILNPKFRVTYNHVYYIIPILIFLLMILAYFYKKKRRDYLKEINRFKGKTLNREDLFTLTEILRDYLKEKHNIDRGLSLKDMSGIFKDRLKQFFEIVDSPKYSKANKNLDGRDILKVLTDIFSEREKKI